MATARRQPLKADSSGQYSRQIGWLKGKKGQKKFRLGKDLSKAEVAYTKLGLLWDVVERERQAWLNRQTHFDEAPPTGTRPTWPDDALAIAEAIRKHHHSVHVGQPDHIEGADAYADYLDGLRERFGTLIQIVPADPELAAAGQAGHAFFAEKHSRRARRSARIANAPIPAGLVGTSLYQAIDAYAHREETRTSKEHVR